jgi:DNA replication protein DnaC
MAISRERSDNVIPFHEERTYGVDLKPEPEKTWPLQYSGVPKLFGECTFDTYQGNELLVDDLRGIVGSENHIVLRGNTGCGKTHLAVAMIQGQNAFKARFITVPDLLLKIRSSFSGGSESEDEIISRYSEIPVLVLDDLGAEKISEFAITTLYIILDRRIRECRKTIITTNLSKEEIEATFGARIASRLAGMENIKINMPDYRKNRL